MVFPKEVIQYGAGLQRDNADVWVLESRDTAILVDREEGFSFDSSSGVIAEVGDFEEG